MFIAFVCVEHANAQTDTSFRAMNTIKGDIIAFTVDNLDNIYLLSSTNQVKKLNNKGDSAAIFNDVKKFGKATLIDVSNPLKILLYYRDFATIVVLDRFLTILNTIDLRKQNILQVRAIGQSYDNKIWVYDELENKLKKIDEDGNCYWKRLIFASYLIKRRCLKRYLTRTVMYISMIPHRRFSYLTITGR